jgi:deoxyribose-phosphate aldolase
MEYNKYIDHTLLSPTATEKDIRKLCAEALKYDFASVCVNGDYVELAHSLLNVPGSTVHVCTVVGFPLGSMDTIAKVDEAKEAIFCGADEIDMVINISWLKDKKYDMIKFELERMRRTCGSKILKVILECCLLTDEEKIKACELCKEASVDFVKTSTGFSTGGATVHDVELMKKVVGDYPHIKASGGIRDKETMLAMIKAGATRIGTSHGVDLIK